MDHADSAREGVRWARQVAPAVVQNDAAFVRAVDALQDAHQRRLARAVAADDGVDRRRRDGQDRPGRSARTGPNARVTSASAEANLDAGRFRHLKKSG